MGHGHGVPMLPVRAPWERRETGWGANAFTWRSHDLVRAMVRAFARPGASDLMPVSGLHSVHGTAWISAKRIQRRMGHLF
jgi:hypothetical protein